MKRLELEQLQANTLAKGQDLPPELPPEPPVIPPKKIFVLGAGDSAASIAMMYGVRAEEIIRLNNLSSPDVKVGQTLKIPPPLE